MDRTRLPKPNPKRTGVYSADNRAAAAIIIANPVRYAGLPLMWAQRFTQNTHVTGK